MESIDDINEIEKFSTKSNDINSIKMDETKKYCCCCKAETYLKFNFKIMGLFFAMFFFIGLYQFLWIINSTKEEVIFGLKSFLFRTNRTDYYSEDFNYIKNYENNIFKNLPDFNLFYVWSLIGNLILKCCDYHISLIIYIIINAGFIFLFRLFNFPDSYGLKQLLLIILFYAMFSFSIGSIALFSQQIYLNGLNKYNLKERSQIKEIPIINNNDDDISENKKEKQNENQNAYFFYLFMAY